MFDPTEIAERHAAMLKKLAEVSMHLVGKLADEVGQAETFADKALMAHAVDRMGRSVRLSLAQEARVVRDVLRRDREDRTLAAERLAVRKAKVHAAVARSVRTVPDMASRIRLEREAADRIEEEALYDAFADGPLETHIVRLRQTLGLPEDHPQDVTLAEPAEPGPPNGQGAPPLLRPDAPLHLRSG